MSVFLVTTVVLGKTQITLTHCHSQAFLTAMMGGSICSVVQFMTVQTEATNCLLHAMWLAVV